MSRNRKYLHEIGDILESVNYGKLEILEQVRIESGKLKSKVKGYIYKCQRCGNIDKIRENDLINNKGCNVCCVPSQKTLKGYNDLWTTHPEIAKLLKNREIGFMLSAASHKKEEFICNNCTHVNRILVSNITKRGFICTRCSDGISYPEKFIICLLSQLRINFERQMVFDWSKGVAHINDKLNGDKMYDFFIPSLNCIIETHGNQHYSISFQNMSSKTRTLQEEQENDRLKENLAKNNEIEKYIIIDCSLSQPEHIKNNVINSEISSFFDLSDIDWSKCHEYACNSLVKVVCDLWNRGNKSTIKLGEHVKLGQLTIIKYLKQGKLLGWCDYDSKESHTETLKKNHVKRKKSIIQLSKNGDFIKEWDSIREASNELNICETSIVKTCKGVNKSSCGFKWMYKNDYELAFN